MTLEIANRLCAYRKHHNLSQEDLAARIGVSRQAISKWERAEASPDTDNLILLSQEYGVTLDDLLYRDPIAEEPDDSNHTKQPKTTISFHDGFHVDTPDESVHIDSSGIHVDTSDESVHIDSSGIHVDDSNDHVRIDLSGRHTKGKHIHSIVIDEDGTKHFFDSDGNELDPESFSEETAGWYRVWRNVPWPILCSIAYLLLGFLVPGGWAYGWLLFLTVPLYYSLGKAILRKDAHHFAYPVLVCLAYLALGLLYGLWHPYWLIFLTIPLYYSLFSSKKKK